MTLQVVVAAASWRSSPANSRCAGFTCGRPSGCVAGRRAAATGGFATRMGARAGACRPRRRRRTHDRYAIDRAGYRVRRVGEPVDPDASDDGVRRRVGDVRRRADLGRVDPGAGRRDARTPEREPRRSRIQHRSDLPAARRASCRDSAAGGGRVDLHDRVVRPEPGRRSAASRTGTRVASGAARLASGVAGGLLVPYRRDTRSNKASA